MKLVWSPETASKAYIDTVKSCELFKESGVPEFVSAMAAGWDAQLVVSTWSEGGPIATSVGLAVAASHSGGKHVCVVPNEGSKSEYVMSMRKYGQEAAGSVVVGPPEKAMEGLEGVDFLVVDCRRKDFARMINAAKLGQRGAVLICKNASELGAASDFRWRSVVGRKSRIVRSVFLPVGKGLDVAHVGARVDGKDPSRWIKRIDEETGEELLIWKRVDEARLK